MDSKNFWKLFETSGSVDDYMNFKKEGKGEPCDNKEEEKSANNDNGACSEGDKDG